MFTTFAIDPDALVQIDKVDPLKSYDIHELIIKCWTKYGVLVFPEISVKESKLTFTINKLDEQFKKLWQVALRTNKSIPGDKAWAGNFNLECLPDIKNASKKLDVCFLEDTLASLLAELGPFERSKKVAEAGNVEVCKFSSAPWSMAFQNAQTLLNSPIQEKEATGKLWAERFLRPMSFCNTLFIMDRYCVKDFMLTRTHNKMSGLERTLLEAAKRRYDQKKVSIKIVSALPENVKHSNDVFNEFEALLPILKSKGIREISLMLVNDKAMEKKAHYRYMRFDDTVIRLDYGIDVLSGSQVFRDCPVTIENRKENPIFDNTEAYLEAASQAGKMNRQYQL